MTKQAIQLAGSAALLLGLAIPSFAEVKLNDNFSVSGYVEGSYQFTDPDPGPATDKFNIDSAQLLFTGNFKPVTAVASLFYVPNAVQETTLLDAYVTYDAGGGVSITGGKFLSYLGYESFFTVNNPEITFANGDFLAAIPGYHDGVRLDYSDKDWGAGVALLDSVGSPFYLKGDGELKHNAGFEGYLSYKGVTDLTLWAGAAYDTQGGYLAHSNSVFDFWAQYQMDKKTMVAAEFATRDGGTGAKGYNWLTLCTYSFTDKISTAFRLSGEKMNNGGPGFIRYTIAPGVAVTDKLTVRAEVTYTDYDKFTSNNAVFAGVQAFIKF
ncbi:MAG TPA: outer membrane beta-barrel protein [Opitutaceae bacterium]|nr:outer membrane beta-barrel protein [Opitutaceae bacterium]